MQILIGWVEDMKNRIIFLLMLLVFAIAAGCSSNVENPTTPNENLVASSTGIGRTVVGTWQAQIDPVSLAVNIVPARQTQIHYNVTTMINPPECDDCVQIEVNGWVETNLDVDFYLTNQYNKDAYDVRLIMMTGDADYGLANADDWTKLWDYPGGGLMNPFLAYAESVPNRLFAIGETYMEKAIIDLANVPSIPLITYSVDLSWPDNCNEPYNIDNFQQDGMLAPDIGQYVNITVDVFDWQNDVSKVTIVAPEITGYGFTQLYHIDGNTWGTALYNNAAAPAGQYNLRMIASSSNSTIALYDYVTVQVGTS
jgi:hypothetical protein